MTIDDPLGLYLQHMKVRLVINLPWTMRYLDERVGQDHMASSQDTCELFYTEIFEFWCSKCKV